MSSAGSRLGRRRGNNPGDLDVVCVSRRRVVAAPDKDAGIGDDDQTSVEQFAHAKSDEDQRDGVLMSLRCVHVVRWIRFPGPS